MAPPIVEIIVEQSKLTIKTNNVPELLKSVHRIFFANILGFEIPYDSKEYVIRKVNLQKTLLEVVRYLKGGKIGLELNSAAKNLLLEMEDNASRFAKSKKEGRLLKENEVKSIAVPGLKRPLKDYQIPAVAHMINVGNAANFSVPGSGKTSIVLSAYAILKERNEINKLVVIGPRSSFMPWEEEFYACFQKKPTVSRIVGVKNVRKKIYRDIGASEIVLLTYQMASKEIEELINILQDNKVLLVLDESHNIKRLEGGIWSDAVITLASYAKRRVILTGTPVPNSLLDLWSQTTFLWPNTPILGTKNRFKYQVEKFAEKSIEEIKNKIYPFYWRIRKKDLNLPKPHFHLIKVHMKRYQRMIYDTLATKILSEVIQEPEERIKLRLWRRAKMVCLNDR